MAKKCAEDGAKVVIAAKTVKPHPTLPGTIFTAAKEVEEAGGEALPIELDIRNDDQIVSAVEKTVSELGGIDILINNAAAISITDTENTTMKKYDLMHDINGRGVFLMSKICMPHLLESANKGRNPHILNNSPPIDLRPEYVYNGLAYTMAKYNASLCTVGMAHEFKGKIAVNSLWPQLPVWTPAVEFMMPQIKNLIRTAHIQADAAYGILSQSTNFTGQFLLDEAYLRDYHDITDFTGYQMDPTADPKEIREKYFMDRYERRKDSFPEHFQ